MSQSDWPFLAGYFVIGALFALATRRTGFSLAERVCAWPFYALAYLMVFTQHVWHAASNWIWDRLHRPRR